MPNNRNASAGTTLVKRIDPAEYGLPEGHVSDPALVQDAFAHAAARGCNLLAPLSRVEIPPQHEVALSVVVFPADGEWNNRSNGVWYEVKGGKLALHRSSLDQLAAAAGLSTVAEHCHTERLEPFVWKSTQTYTGRGFDGEERTITKSVEVDLRDGSEDAREAGKGLPTARKFGHRLAESKAANRAIRGFLGIRGAYSRAEAGRPFVFPRLRWVPDMSDPVVARMVAAKHLGVVDQLFGAEAKAAHTAGAFAHPEDVIDATEDPAAPRRLPDNQAARDIEDQDQQQQQRLRERVPVERSEDPDWSQDRPRQQESGPPPCTTCGQPLTDQVANFSLDTYGDPFCYDHQPRGQQSRRGD